MHTSSFNSTQKLALHSMASGDMAIPNNLELVDIADAVNILSVRPTSSEEKKKRLWAKDICTDALRKMSGY